MARGSLGGIYLWFQMAFLKYSYMSEGKFLPTDTASFVAFEFSSGERNQGPEPPLGSSSTSASDLYCLGFG